MFRQFLLEVSIIKRLQQILFKPCHLPEKSLKIPRTQKPSDEKIFQHKWFSKIELLEANVENRSCIENRKIKVAFQPHQPLHA